VVLRFDPVRVEADVRRASTEDLLDRVTVYRAGMEAEALAIIEAELSRRGVDAADIEAHARSRAADALPLPDGTAVRCTFCNRPAVYQGWGWHRVWGLVPVFPRYFSYCALHRSAPSRAENAVNS
jgi:hypothetical protein